MGEDKYIDQMVLKGKSNGIFLDIGAHDGKTFSNSYFFEKYRNWKGICIEPLPEIFKKLNKNRSAITINACVGEKEGKQEFLEVSGDGNAEMFSGLVNSFDKRQIANIKKEIKNRNGKIKKTVVRTIPLSKILEENKIKHVDYCSIDTEGNELEVLKSIDFDKCTITCLTVEELFEDKKLRKFLKSKGYKIVKKLDKDLVCVHKSFLGDEITKKINNNTKKFNQSISVVIHTKNEEKNIKDCIDSVKKFANEIIVADMNSTDKTVRIAEKENAIVINVPEYGFADPARNTALSKATKDWVFVLDADERLTPKLITTIKKIIASDTCDVVSFPRKNIMFDKWIKHGLRWPDYQVRLFKNGFANWSDNIHDPAHYAGILYNLPSKESNAIIHYHSDSIRYLMDKTYLQASLERFYDNDKDLSIETVYSRMENEFPWRFYEHEGYKDGMHGIVVNKFMQFYRFLEFAMYWERNGKPEISDSEEIKKLWVNEEKMHQSLEELKKIKDSKFFVVYKLYEYIKNKIKSQVK